MIPASNYDDDDYFSINISSYTTPENYYNYLNYRVTKHQHKINIYILHNLQRTIQIISLQ